MQVFMQALPDVQSDLNLESASTLQWVGMEEIAIPLCVADQQGKIIQLSAKANVFVSLDAADAKGIHMSRLYLAINQFSENPLSAKTIETLLDFLVSSQKGISEQAKIELSFDLMLNKPALLSGQSGFQSYPVVIRAVKNADAFDYQLDLTIPYSSTCPCSASLTRQLYANSIDVAFPSEVINKDELLAWAQSQAGSVATPHSQRSYAYVKMDLSQAGFDSLSLDLSALIFALEKSIGTPVQTAVKRSDEQEFARLNAQNLMFCEDAARKLKAYLQSMSDVEDYWFKVDHQESLHAHNAVAIDCKPGGKYHSSF